MLSLTALLLIYSTIIVPENYKTIQEAVTNASLDDTIIVSEGNYKENVSVTKPVSIISRKGPEFTTVRAAVPSEPVFKVSNVNNVAITGFTATGSLLSGIYLYNSNNATITDNKTVKNGRGIILYGSSNNMLTGNSADANKKYGIYLESSHRNSLVKNSASSNNDNGIFLSSSSYNNLTDNNVNHNTWNGIILWDSSNNTLKDNRIWRNRFGIVISGGGNNTLINNSTWSNIYVIMPLILAYIGIISYLVQRRVLQTIYRV
ncbi:MAG: NosD domain-containing protein [Deltaproteobacteria bacterium]|nr:NosD domain-containing protein [Deltaproteobacteria bacterium]